MNRLLPITKQLIESLRAQAGDEMPCSGEKPVKVLVVEDDQNDAFFMRRVLTDIGCEVTLIGNGLEAAELLKSNPNKFCIMFLDINLPGMDGMDVLKLAHKVAPNVHVIIVTGGTRAAEIPHNTYYGIVRKPLSESLATEIIDKTTGSKS